MYAVAPFVIAPSVRLMPEAVIPAVPATTAVCAALRPPPTPTQMEPLETVSLSAVAWLRPAPETMSRSKLNVPAAATKPLPMSSPTVPSTLRSVAAERLKPKLPPPSMVSSDQSIGPATVALLSFTSRFET